MPRIDGAIEWLLDGDPAIRWQTLRDLAGAGEHGVMQERKRVARDGWGAQLLALQDPAVFSSTEGSSPTAASTTAPGGHGRSGARHASRAWCFPSSAPWITSGP